MRLALNLSPSVAGKRAEISPRSWIKIEASEDSGQIKLVTLQKAAQAMGCELVYAIRPKNQRPIADTLFDELMIEMRKDKRDQFVGKRLAYYLHDKMYDPAYRRLREWARNSEPCAQDVCWYKSRLRLTGTNFVRGPLGINRSDEQKSAETEGR